MGVLLSIALSLVGAVVWVVLRLGSKTAKRPPN